MVELRLNQTISKMLKLFEYVGFWPSEEESALRRAGKKFSITGFYFLFPIFFGINAVLSESKVQSIYMGQLGVFVCVQLLKLLYLIFRKRDILAFLSELPNLHPIEDDRLNRKLKRFMTFIHSYLWILSMSVVFNISYSALSSDQILPMFIRFTWYDSQFAYWIVFLYDSLSIVLSVVSTPMSIIIWYIMLNHSIAYELLGKRIANLGRGRIEMKSEVKILGGETKGTNKDDQKKKSKIPLRDTYAEDLIVVVKDHRKLTESIHRFKSCFYYLFLAQITISKLVVCISIYNLAYASMSSVLEIEMYILILLYGIFEIYLAMYLANEITLASGRLSYCLFESNWIEQTESCKKNVLILGERLKQPLELIILIYPMNLQTFTTILNGAYSLFNILKEVQ